MEPLLLRPEDVAKLLSVGRSKTYQLIQRGEIPSVRLGHAVRVPVDALRRWIAETEQARSGAR